MFSLKFSAQEFTGNFKRRWILVHLNVPEISHKILRCLCNALKIHVISEKCILLPSILQTKEGETILYVTTKKNQNDDLLNILQESHFLLFDHDILKI